MAHSTNQEEEEEGGAWAFLWLLFAFKLATIAVIFYYHQTWEAGLVLGAASWHWAVMLIPLLAGPIAFHYRLRRVRAKRELLRRAEWMLDAEPEPARSIAPPR